MGIFVRAVVYGFGFSLGAALYKRVSDRLGLDKPKGEPRPAEPEGDTCESESPPDEAE